MKGRIDFKKEEWAPDTFDMDSLALQPVPDPNGKYPLYKYASVLGTPGLTAFVGFEGLAEAKEVRFTCFPAKPCLQRLIRAKQSSFLLALQALDRQYSTLMLEK